MKSIFRAMTLAVVTAALLLVVGAGSLATAGQQAKITISVGQPIDLREKLGTNADAEEAYELVTTNMQRTLTRLGNERTVPVLG